MRPFTPEIAEKLNAACVGESIDWIGLGAHQFQFGCGLFNVRCEYKASLSIGGASFEWAGTPLDAPVWKLAGGEISNVTVSGDALTFILSTGDSIKAWANDGPYEAVIVEAQSSGFLEVF